MSTVDVEALVPFCALIRRDDHQELIPGVLVQGPFAPCILTCLHAFEPIGRTSDEFHVQLQAPIETVRCRVSDYDIDHDFIILEINTHINRVTAPIDLTVFQSCLGQPYILFGNSTSNGVCPSGSSRLTWNVTRGHISSTLLDSHKIAIDGGSALGDLGGPVFHEISRKLIGVNVSMALLPVGNDFRATIRAQARPQGRMIPTWIIELILQARLGHPFFGPGGVCAAYTDRSGGVVSPFAHGASPQQPAFVPRHEYELLC